MPEAAIVRYAREPAKDQRPVRRAPNFGSIAKPKRFAPGDAMYRYQPPKSAIWGHALGRMSCLEASERFQRFLQGAVAQYRFSSGMANAGDCKPLAERFDAIVGGRPMPASLTEAQSAQCLEQLVEWEAQGGSREGVMVQRAFEIGAWRIAAEAVPTSSIIMMRYGAIAGITTFLAFSELSHFETVRRAFEEAGLGSLNPKHLKGRPGGDAAPSSRRT